MATAGYYQNPSTKDCWKTCSACLRCDQKGKYAKCVNCSGRHDPFGQIDPHPDDWCNCTEGVLRFVTSFGKHTIVKYKGDPFSGQVITKTKTADENDWTAYLQSIREKTDNPYFDPIIINDGRIDPRASQFKYLGTERTD